MATINEIREHLKDTATYHGMSFASIVQVAAEIEGVKVEGKQERDAGKREQFDERAELRREFRQAHSLTSQVWARVDKRFSGFEKRSSQVIRAFSYSCQLPYANGMSLIASHADHLDEPGALGLVLADVNAELTAKRNGNGTTHKPSLAEQNIDIIDKYSSTAVKAKYTAVYDALNDITDELAALDAVRRALAKREAK